MPTNVKTLNELVEYINHGNTVKYLYFWGHQKPKSGVSKSCLSQWHDSSFVVGKYTYITAEHYMMAEKARLFGDENSALKVVNAKNPGEAKEIGRGVLGFDEKTWCEHRFDIVVRANLEKFTQNPDLQSFLLDTGDKVLVEASPVDKIWGIGLSMDDPLSENPNTWKGLNLLGFALMQVRELLLES